MKCMEKMIAEAAGQVIEKQMQEVGLQAASENPVALGPIRAKIRNTAAAACLHRVKQDVVKFLSSKLHMIS